MRQIPVHRLRDPQAEIHTAAAQHPGRLPVRMAATGTLADSLASTRSCSSASAAPGVERQLPLHFGQAAKSGKLAGPVERRQFTFCPELLALLDLGEAGARRGSERPRCGMLRRDRRVQAAKVLSIVGIVVLALRNRRRGDRMSDPGRHGPAADTAPKVRGKRFREHMARLLADVAGWRQDSYADLKQQLDIRTKELSESLERETATSEVLGIISSSPSDLEPVFGTILANATRLCEASYGTLWLCEGDAVRAVALHGPVPAAFAAERRSGVVRPDPRGPIARAVKMRQTVHVADLRTEQAYLDRDPLAVTAVELGGIRTSVNVPMLSRAR